MWYVRYLVEVLGFVMLERLDNILVKGEANIKGTSRENKGHKIHIQWDKVVFLDYKRNWKMRKVKKKAVYISAINPIKSMNKKGF